MKKICKEIFSSIVKENHIIHEIQRVFIIINNVYKCGDEFFEWFKFKEMIFIF